MGLSRRIINSDTGRQFANLISKILSYVNIFLPKTKNKIVFYAPESDFLTDNSKALYNYLIEHDYNKTYKIICIIPQADKAKLNNVNNVQIVGIYKGLYHYLTSAYIFYSFGSMRIKASNKQKIVNLTHGTPLKSLGSFEVNKRYGEEDLDDFTYIISASDYYKPIIAKAFGCTDDKVIIQGHARNDYLFSSKRVFGDKMDNFSKSILWMPTFRVLEGRYNDLGLTNEYNHNQTGLPLLETYEDLSSVNEFLLTHNILLAIKIHPGASFNDINYSNIKLYTNSDLDEANIELYEFVKEFDALLTDYSSIYFDYLLLNRPIGFTIDDFHLYEKNRGFSVESPLELMPGHHIKTITDLEEYLLDVLSNNDLYKENRNRINKLVNNYKDDQNRKRLLKYIGIDFPTKK